MSLVTHAVAALLAAVLGRSLPLLYTFTGVAAFSIVALISRLNRTSSANGSGTSASGDVYQLDHAVLNIQRPKTMWLNMGYWKDTSSFPGACEALAMRLGKHANLANGDRILEVGCGCGASVPVWLTHFGASEVVAVTAVAAHVEQAHQAIGSNEHIPLNAKSEVHVGDAILFSRDLANKGEHFDRVIALDCAYHFHTRKEFLKQAEALLDFTGTIGLTDLMLPSQPLSAFSGALMRVICYMAGVPFSNLISQQEYEKQLSDLGFTQIDIEDITTHVFPGLAGYIDRINADPRLTAALDPAKLRQYRAFARVLRWWNGGRLRFVLVKAMKGVSKRRYLDI